MAIIAIYCGYEYHTILDMPFIFYRSILKNLSKVIHFNAFSNLLANPYADKAMDVIKDFNPLAPPPKNRNVTLDVLRQLELL